MLTGSVYLRIYNDKTYANWNIEKSTDGFWFNNSRVEYLLVGGLANDENKVGMSRTGYQPASTSTPWSIESITDGLYRQNDISGYIRVGGATDRGLACGMSLITYASEITNTSWNIGNLYR